MVVNMEALGHSARTILLARIAHAVTISAGSTYEVGTDNISAPRVLRGYNEFLHPITASLLYHIKGDDKFPLEAVLTMLQEFGNQFDRLDEVAQLLRTALEMPLPTEH